DFGTLASSATIRQVVGPAGLRELSRLRKRPTLVRMRIRLFLLTASALSVLSAASGQEGPRVVLEPGFLHLRNVGPREWSSFPEKAEAAGLKVAFDLESPESFHLLT